MFILTLSTSLLSCKVDDRIMYGIATIEKHISYPVGYPFLISFNSKKDIVIIKKELLESVNYFIDERTIDCINLEICTKLLNDINSMNIYNLDLGCYQINQNYWKMDNCNYFNIEESYKKACSIIANHNKNEWSWENIAKYHSKTKKYNEKYKKELLKVLNNIN